MRLSTPVVSIYLMADVDLVELAEAAVRGGAGLLEIGIPFSDPLADGPTVQRAGQRALRNGMTTPRALELLAEVRARVPVPLTPMTYASPVMAYGERRFCADAAAAGADGLIVPDVPADEAGLLADACAEHGLGLVPLLAPTSTDERIEIAGLIARVRPHTRLPLLVGFGISTPAHVTAMLDAGADGVVIGSRAIEVAEQGGPAALEAFVADAATALPVSN
jgi:tryptophan synthase alpha chain